MRDWKVLMLVLALMLPAYSWAVCPTEKTTIFFINGVDTEEFNAINSKEKLAKEVLAKTPDNLKDCLSFDYAYNTDELLKLDFIEAGLQKSEELDRSTSLFWKVYLRALAMSQLPGFNLLADDLYRKVAREAALYVLGDQVAEHLVKYREHLAQGRRVILVPHSQGSFYANQEWLALSATERGKTRLVAVATPADSVADGGPYTTLTEDGFARKYFLLALPANAANTEPCGDEYRCHGFKESYLSGTNSRTRIVNAILALLPIPVTGGTIEGMVGDGFGGVLSGWTVSLYQNLAQAPIANTTTDARGVYRLTGVRAGTYVIRAYARDDAYGAQTVTVREGEASVVNFPPPVPV